MARIVLIEDDNDLRELLADSLVADGHDVWSTRDADIGVRQCERLAADITITDLAVPNSEQLEKLVTLQQTNRGLQVIVISGGLDSPTAAGFAARLAGPHVLAKPFKTTQLLRLVEELRGEFAGRS